MNNYKYALDPKNILPAAGGFMFGNWAQEGLSKVKNELSNIAGEGVDKEHNQYFEVTSAVEGLLQCLQTVGVSSFDYQTLLNSLWESALSYDDIKNSGIIDSMCKLITMGSIDSGNGTPEQTASLVVNFVKTSMQKRMDINLTKNQLNSIYDYYQTIRKSRNTPIDGLGLLKAFVTDPAKLDLIFALLAWNSGFDPALLDSSTEMSRIRSEITGPDSSEFEKARKMKEEIIETQITQDKLDTAILDLRRNVDIQRKNMIQWLNLQFADAAGTDLAKQITSQLGPLINGMSLVSAFAGNAYQFFAPNVKATTKRTIFKQAQQNEVDSLNKEINQPQNQPLSQQNQTFNNIDTSITTQLQKMRESLIVPDNEYQNILAEINLIKKQFEQEYNKYSSVLKDFSISSVCNLGKGEGSPSMEMFSPNVVETLYSQLTENHKKLETLFKQTMDIYDSVYKFINLNKTKYQSDKNVQFLFSEMMLLTNPEAIRKKINDHRTTIFNILRQEKSLYFFSAASPVLNFIFQKSYYFCTSQAEYEMAKTLPGHAGLTAAYNTYKQSLEQLYGIIYQGAIAIQTLAQEAKNKEVLFTANIILNSLKFSLDELKREMTKLTFGTAETMGANIAKLT